MRVSIVALMIFVASCGSLDRCPDQRPSQATVRARARSLPAEVESYLQPGRLTDLGPEATLLDALPVDADGIGAVARVQTVHYRMFPQWRTPPEQRDRIPRIWPFQMAVVLENLAGRGSGRIDTSRKLEDRVVSSCTQESILLASFLRYRGVPARIRVGYLTGLHQGPQAEEFWQNVNEYEWGDRYTREKITEITTGWRQVDKTIEHWIAEYWDGESHRWQPYDVRTEYAGAYGFEVGPSLAPHQFEYAWQAWFKMKEPGFNPDTYDESDLDGRSHIRQQLLYDFYNLLNHEAAGWGDDGEAEQSVRRFVRARRFSELSEQEAAELDAVADLMKRGATPEQFVELYRTSSTLRLPTVEADSYSFVAQLQGP